MAAHRCPETDDECNGRERGAMNGETKKEIALGVIALGVGVALGAVLGNEQTKNSLIDKGKNWFNSRRQS